MLKNANVYYIKLDLNMKMIEIIIINCIIRFLAF